MPRSLSPTEAPFPPRLLQRLATRPGRAFTLVFMTLCALFVPVVVNLGLIATVAPVSYFLGSLIFGLLRGPIRWRRWKIVLYVLLNITVYTAAFAAIGALLGWLILKLPWRTPRHVLIVAILLVPIAASFARVITYGSIQGRGGSYTFWEAIVRYQERQTRQ